MTGDIHGITDLGVSIFLPRPIVQREERRKQGQPRAAHKKMKVKMDKASLNKRRALHHK